MHATELLVPKPNTSEVGIATEKLKTYYCQGIDQILAKLMQKGGNRLFYLIHKVINSILV